jgi:hypothetical protein
MDTNFLFGISLTASFLAGVLALFAPCCITFLFPSYLGTIFKENKRVMYYTLVFALGLGLILVPIALGLRFAIFFLDAYHLQVYYLGNETDPPEGRRAGEAKVDPQPNGYRSLSLTLKNQGGQLRQFQLLVRNDDPRSTDIYRPLLLAEDRVLLPWDEAGLTNLHLGLEVLAKK